MSDNASTFRQAFDLLCDQAIGRGMSRQVYSSKILPDCVIKVEETSCKFQNVVEWETWQRVKGTPFSRWFAECRWISPNGTILIMERTRPPSPSEFPDKLPLFLTDTKRSNYGMSSLPSRDGISSNGWFVCHDYGTHLGTEYGLTKRLKKVQWWDE